MAKITTGDLKQIAKDRGVSYRFISNKVELTATTTLYRPNVEPTIDFLCGFARALGLQYRCYIVDEIGNPILRKNNMTLADLTPYIEETKLTGTECAKLLGLGDYVTAYYRFVMRSRVSQPMVAAMAALFGGVCYSEIYDIKGRLLAGGKVDLEPIRKGHPLRLDLLPQMLAAKKGKKKRGRR